MKKGVVTIVFFVLIAASTTESVWLPEIPCEALVTTPDTNWEVFYDALCWVESNNNPNAIGKTDDVGIIQITPIYVEDVNRIICEDKYSLQDRFCPIKSREMFDIYQAHYNPEKDIDKAIRLHNPRAGEWYSKRIKERMYGSISDNRRD